MSQKETRSLEKPEWGPMGPPGTVSICGYCIHQQQDDPLECEKGLSTDRHGRCTKGFTYKRGSTSELVDRETPDEPLDVSDRSTSEKESNKQLELFLEDDV